MLTHHYSEDKSGQPEQEHQSDGPGREDSQRLGGEGGRGCLHGEESGGAEQLQALEHGAQTHAAEDVAKHQCDICLCKHMIGCMINAIYTSNISSVLWY
jgi:hypothetical protein